MFDRTLVLLLARLYEDVDTRIEHMFVYGVLNSYDVFMSGTPAGATDKPADLVFNTKGQS